MYQNEEHKRGVIERGDGYEYIGSYKCDEITIDGKNKKRNGSYIRVKCPYCGKEYDIETYAFVKGNKSKCNYCCNFYEKSFAYHIQQELKEPLNKYWDWEKNTVNPYLINKYYKEKVVIKCDKKDYHGEYTVKPLDFVSETSRCPYCTSHHGKVHLKDSFGQWLIDTYGEDAIKKYWSDKNITDPFKLSKSNNKNFWLLCQQHEYHNDNGGYLTRPHNFIKGNRCPYCSTRRGKVHLNDSFGALYPEKAKYWSENNKKSPYEVTPKTSTKYKFICEKCGKEFSRQLDNLNRVDTGVICKKCNSSKGETRIIRWLDKNNINYIHDEPYFKDLIGFRNGLLRPDFILPDHKIWIEYDGRQHEEWCEGWQTKEEFEIQQTNDGIKNEYAKKYNWTLIRIKENDFNNIEIILKNLFK